MILFEHLGLNKIGYEVYYLVQRLFSQPATVLYNLILTGALTLGKASSENFVAKVFNQAGTPNYSIGLGSHYERVPHEDKTQQELRMTGMDAPLWNEKEVTAVVPYVFERAYPGAGLPGLEGLETQSGYLRDYRSQYTFDNFVTSELKGLLL